MIKWNPNFVRDLAESVLDRARVIRAGLSMEKPVAKKTKKASVVATKPKRRPVVARSPRRAK